MVILTETKTDLIEQLGHIPGEGGKGELTRDHGVEDDSAGPDVDGRSVDLLPVEELGRRVLR